MAITIIGKSQCVLCGEIIAKGDEVVATSHFIGDKTDSFFRYSDAPFHKRYFLAWDRRAEFVRHFNELVSSQVFGNGTRHRMLDDGRIAQERA
ncbi:MAG TPA: hypothetical protein VGL42_06675 [Opitutaceae bacterium]|jgi:hypothetical protein